MFSSRKSQAVSCWKQVCLAAQAGDAGLRPLKAPPSQGQEKQLHPRLQEKGAHATQLRGATSTQEPSCELTSTDAAGLLAAPRPPPHPSGRRDIASRQDRARKGSSPVLCRGGHRAPAPLFLTCTHKGDNAPTLQFQDGCHSDLARRSSWEPEPKQGHTFHGRQQRLIAQPPSSKPKGTLQRDSLNSYSRPPPSRSEKTHRHTHTYTHTHRHTHTHTDTHRHRHTHTRLEACKNKRGGT